MPNRSLDQRRHAALSCLLVLCFAPALAGEPGRAALPRAWIRPSLVNMKPQQQQRFRVRALLHRLDEARLLEPVRWCVNGVPGGSAEFGTISRDGVYRAPAAVPRPREVRISAEVEGVANRYLWATVVLGEGPPTYTFLRRWSEPVGASGRMVAPHGITVGHAGEILLIDRGANRVFRYSNTGEYRGELGDGPDPRSGRLVEPRHAAVDSKGFIYVCSGAGDGPRFSVFSPEGRFVRSFAEKGNRPGMLLRPHGAGFDSQGRLFAVDVDNYRVSVYSGAGEFLFHWGEDGLYPGQFNAPHGLVVDPSGDIFVSNYFTPVQKFTPDGHFLCAFAWGEPPDGPVHIHAIGGDPWGNVYLAVRPLPGASDRTTIVKYNNNGDFVTKWSLSSEERRPNWVAGDAGGLVYVAYHGKADVGVEVYMPE